MIQKPVPELRMEKMAIHRIWNYNCRLELKKLCMAGTNINQYHFCTREIWIFNICENQLCFVGKKTKIGGSM